MPAQAREEERRSGTPLPRLRLTVRGRRATWSPKGLRYDVQVRRGRRWRTVARATTATSLRVGRRVTAIRVRPRAADGRAGGWTARRTGAPKRRPL